MVKYTGIAAAVSLSLLTPGLLMSVPAAAQISIGVSVDVEPPPLVVYAQPPLPAPG
jgi:hypothetical protein